MAVPEKKNKSQGLSNRALSAKTIRNTGLERELKGLRERERIRCWPQLQNLEGENVRENEREITTQKQE